MHAANGEVLDPTFLEESLEIKDWVILEDFYNTFLQQLYSFLESVDERQTAMSASQLRHQAHKLRSSCKTVGANPLAQLFEDLEELHRGSATSTVKGIITEIQALGWKTATSVERLLELRAAKTAKNNNFVTHASTSSSPCNTGVELE